MANRNQFVFMTDNILIIGTLASAFPSCSVDLRSRGLFNLGPRMMCINEMKNQLVYYFHFGCLLGVDRIEQFVVC